MKHAVERWRKFKDKALSRKRQPLSRPRQGAVSQFHQTQVLLLAVVEFLEHDVCSNYPSSAKASLLVEAIHDWKEALRGN